MGLNANTASTSESHWLARQLHNSAGATSQGNRNKMFRGWFCSSIEMLRGSCSYLLLDGGERVHWAYSWRGSEIDNTNAPLIH